MFVTCEYWSCHAHGSHMQIVLAWCFSSSCQKTLQHIYMLDKLRFVAFPQLLYTWQAGKCVCACFFECVRVCAFVCVCAAGIIWHIKWWVCSKAVGVFILKKGKWYGKWTGSWSDFRIILFIKRSKRTPAQTLQYSSCCRGR